jgi:hypothetical protein
MTTEKRIAFVRRSFDLPTASDADGIVGISEHDGFVISPFLGKMSAPDFSRKIDSASDASTLTVFDVLLGETGNPAAAHFEYDWTLKSGDRIVFHGTDYFQFAASGRFASFSIFYDTRPVREDTGDKYANA